MKKVLTLILALVIILTAVSLASCGKDAASPDTTAATDEATTEEVTTEAPSYETYPEEIVGVWTTKASFAEFMEMLDPNGLAAASYAQYGIDLADYDMVWLYDFGENERVKVAIDTDALKDTYHKLFSDLYENAKASGNYTDEMLEILKAYADPEQIDPVVDSVLGQLKDIDKTDTHKYTFSKDQLMFHQSTIRISIDGDTMEFIELMSPLDEAPLYLRHFPYTFTRVD